MDRIQPRERKLLYKRFFNLRQVETLSAAIEACIRNPHMEMVVRGGLDENYIYGIVVELYEVSF